MKKKLHKHKEEASSEGDEEIQEYSAKQLQIDEHHAAKYAYENISPSSKIKYPTKDAAYNKLRFNINQVQTLLPKKE